MRRFLIAAWTLVTVMVVGTVIAVAAGWPAQLGGAGEPDAVLSEFVTRGTALGPPLIPLVVFIGAVLLSRRPGRARAVGLIASMLLALAFVVGAVGEALAAPAEDVPTYALVGNGIIGTVLSVAVFVTGLLALRRRPPSP